MKAVGPTGETRSVPEREARRVWVAAGGRCTLCNRYLADEEVTGRDVPVGQLAHIVGWSSAGGSPRGSDSLPADQRNCAENLILLCHDQHKVADSQTLWDVFDAPRLRSMKRNHEHRIRKLTELVPERTTTVLRLIGNRHARPVELSNQAIANALLERDRFPDWILRGADEFEVDLRALPNEEFGTPAYWGTVWSLLEDRLEHFRTQVRKGAIKHVSVFGMARIPALIMLGTLLDDTVPTDLYQKRRDGDEGWGWTAGSPEIDFVINKLQPGDKRDRVAVMLSVSGTIDRRRLPEIIDSTHTIYEIRPQSVMSKRNLVCNQVTLDRFSQTWREALAVIELDHPGVASIPLFSAIPAAAAVSVGRHIMRATDPPLHIYDRMPGESSYRYMTSSVPPSDQKN